MCRELGAGGVGRERRESKIMEEGCENGRKGTTRNRLALHSIHPLLLPSSRDIQTAPTTITNERCYPSSL